MVRGGRFQEEKATQIAGLRIAKKISLGIMRLENLATD